MTLAYMGKLSLFFLFVIICACSKSEHPQGASNSPAKVMNSVKESDLTTVVLSPMAEERLGIESTMAEYKHIQNTVRIGGEIITPPGHQATITAPMTGTVFGIKSDELLPAGAHVKSGQAVMNLLLLTPEKDLASAREAVEVKAIQLEVAEAKAKRTQQLLLDKATSEKLHLEAQAEFANARASLKAAEARLHLLNGKEMEQSQEGLSTFVLRSPVDGVIQRVYVASRQTVSPATLLFEVISQDPLWVRVPVYVGDMVKIDHQEDAIIESLGMDSNKTVYTARPVGGPLLSDPITTSSDLFFEIANPEDLFRPGQRVSVLLSLLGSGERLVVPWSAVLFDIHGGNWVYVKIADHTYSRQRVEISSVHDGVAVVARGLKRGEVVVTTGVAEIFGTEFGVGK
ncbi:MAG: efflux RND transporter periplasmic adaptor subunit [Candidatus Scalindua sp. AMX11]|nr:MAG: efflux RND transporter periplasmic adaptor subunit [Candidatus Scalindua sp.]TDE65149.1 MAG: efflux RND transporter periplasmic adaptor subunit [Candidatus Scalindua sp. AMX11]